MRTYFFLLLSLLNLGVKTAIAQVDLTPYQENRFFWENDALYTYGIKWKSPHERNTTEDGFENEKDFYVSKYDSFGKKKWEFLYDKKRNFVMSSRIFKYKYQLYFLVAFRNQPLERGPSTLSHFLIKLDSSGKLLQEKKLFNANEYFFRSLYFEEGSILITHRNDSAVVVTDTYDCDFHLLNSSRNGTVNDFYYDSKVFRDKKVTISIGTCAARDIGSEAEWFDDRANYCVKKSSSNPTNSLVTSSIPFPIGDKISHVSTNDNIHFNIITRKKDHYKRPSSIYQYDSKTEKLTLVADTFFRSPIYVHNFSEKEILYIVNAEMHQNERTHVRIDYPHILYLFKDQKLDLKKELRDVTHSGCTKEFRISGKTLFVYNVNYSGTDIEIKTLDLDKDNR